MDITVSEKSRRKTNPALVHFSDVSKIIGLTEAESAVVVERPGTARNGELQY